MNKLNSLFFTAILLITSVSTAQTTWVVDKSHSKIGFSVTHLLITDVEGNFNEFDLTLTSENDNFENAKIDFSAEIGSIDTDNGKRDNHLKSDDFFNAKEFPQMTFVSKSFTKKDKEKYELVGDLTIRGNTKEVTLDATYSGTIKDPWGNTKAGFKATGVINRFEYGLKWSKALEAGGLVVSDEVTINIKLELLKK